MADDPIAEYKTVLSRVMEQRPSGTRQRLADALGKHRSFISQISSPAYATPIPHKHLATIFSVCHFGATEREAFMQAYQRAHPGRIRIGPELHRTRHLTLLVPDLGDDVKNARLDRAIGEFVSRMAELMDRGGGEK